MPGDFILLHMCTINADHMIYIYIQFLKCKLQQTEFFATLGSFQPFYPLENQQNQNSEKLKKLPEDIILHMCIINDNHMMYGS